MAKTYLEGLLGENEKILLETHQHWFVLFGKIFLEILLIALIVVGIIVAYAFYPVAIYGLILVLVPVIGILNDVLVWQNKAYIVTTHRVIQTSGVFSKDVVDSSLEKVNDVKLSQSFLGRLFGYGDIEILTASELGANLFHEINDPVGFKTAMLNAKERLGFEHEIGIEGHAAMDIPSLISRLDDLRKRGIISETEFQKKKAELLAKI
ncbi:MAG TPA: PH domain-containing protein [Anaerolineales bacterium]|nr:PH domain-containing protein [Anaerolineales bacterium]